MVESFVKDLWVSLLSAGHTTGGPSGVVVGSGRGGLLLWVLSFSPALPSRYLSLDTSDVGIFSFGFYHVARSFVSRA